MHEKRARKNCNALRLLISFGVLCLAAALLSGCNLRGRKVQAEPPPPFQSPITEPVGRPGMTVPDIQQVMAERRTDIRSILASVEITVGESRSRTRQQFDANMYSAPPELLRVRGSADAGALFDFLLSQDQVQVLVVPEKKHYQGTLANLRQNQTLMAGIQPDDLMNSFLVEQNLYRILEQYPAAPLKETADHYTITVAYPTGITENYQLRKTDLLIDRLDRSLGRKSTGSVRFDGYQFYGKNNLLPIRFEATLGNGGVATVEVKELQPNAKRNEDLVRLDVPADFQRLPL